MINLPERPARRLVGSMHAHPYLYVLGALILTVAMLALGRDIKLKSKIRDLLPEHAPSVQAMTVLQKRLGSADVLVVTLMSGDFEQVKPALPAIAKALEAHADIRKVVYRQDVDMIQRNALIIFPTLPELEDYYEELTDEIKKAVKSKLQLFDDDDEAEAGADDEAEVRHTYAWAELEQDDGLSNLGRTFREEGGQYREYFFNRAYTTIGLQVYPTKSSSDLAFCEHILEVTDQIVREEVEKTIGPIGEGQPVTRIVMGGGYRDALQQSDQIKNDMASSALTSFALLALVVIVFFRSIRAIFCVLIPLVMGVAWTVGVVALTVGYLNIITAFIFAVLLGLGIDFGIHFYGRYREERAAGNDPLEAMVHTHLHCGEASILAGTTTAGAFLALTIADFKGFSQFGGVAAVGVIFCLLAVVFVFTPLTFIFERWVPLKLMGYSVDRHDDGDIKRARFPLGKRTVLVAGVIGLVGLVTAVNIRFELDFNKLGQKEETALEYQDVVRGTVSTSAPAVIFTDSAQDAEHIYDQLEERTAGVAQHPRIKSYQSIFHLVPDKQDERIKWVKKICRKLGRKVKLFEGDQRDGADELLRHCEPEPFAVQDLPEWVKAKFSDKAGRLGEFIFVAPKGSTSDGEVAIAFSEELATLKSLDGSAPVISGKPMIWADVIRAMERDGVRTTIASLLTVLILLFLFERRVAGVAMIMLPLTLGIGISVGVMNLLGIKLNFFNMLALPTLIGMGVDDGVHLYHRYQELGRLSARYIVRTTGMSAVLTTLTTSIGFGSLLMANHYGLNSLGLLTVIGMVAALFATLVVLPAAMQWADDRKAKVSGEG
ncbi:MAG: MMPL family transporter [Myxococcales bacterium]|nr:MMPL family transporter [Myxococcales bacterium]MCB9535136.1 MMPL family transporter [Myxococcales bacterium]